MTAHQQAADSVDQSGFTAGIDRLADPKELADEWRSLEERAEAAFFLSWHWIGNWLACLPDLPDILRVQRHGETVGLACITWQKVRWRGLLHRRIAHINSTGREDLDVVTIEYNDILVDRRFAKAVRQSALDKLREYADGIVWRGVETHYERYLQQSGWLCHRLAEAPAAWVDLAALRGGGVAYLDSLSANTRQQIRRSLRLYERRGTVRLERAPDVATALTYFRDMAPLHQARWTKRGQPGAFANPFYITMHERVIATAQPAGAVELIRVCCGDEAVGYLYNFTWRGEVAFYLGGMRYEHDNRLKPGLLVHALCIQNHIAGGANVYNFMGGRGRYKTSLGQTGPGLVSLSSACPHLLLRLEHGLRQIKDWLIQPPLSKP